MTNLFSTVPTGTHNDRLSTSAFRLLARIGRPGNLLFSTNAEDASSSPRIAPEAPLKPFDAGSFISAKSIMLSSTKNARRLNQYVFRRIKATAKSATIPLDTELRGNATPARQLAFFDHTSA